MAEYECPKCQADMTEQVKTQCKISVDVPMFDLAGKTITKKKAPESVSLECPNGHWAEYPCPKVSGDGS